MQYQNDINVEILLDKPIWQMTGREFCILTQYANGQVTSSTEKPNTIVYGVQALADALGCSQSTIYKLMRATREEDDSAEGGGVLRDAIVSRIGRKIMFEAEKARALAAEHKQKTYDNE